MDRDRIFSPVAEIDPLSHARGDARHASGDSKPVIGLLNNSKPNVTYFLAALEDELRRGGDYEVVNIVKPRSAAPAPDLASIADRCRYVINAVAD